MTISAPSSLHLGRPIIRVRESIEKDTPMKKIYALLAVTLLALSGCGAVGQATTDVPTSEPATTPTPSPSMLTIEEAGKAYLAAVCPTNLQSNKTTTVLQTEPFDLPAAKTEAVALREAYRTTIQGLSNEQTLWPEAVKSDIAALTEVMYDDLTRAQNVASQTTREDLVSVWNDWTSAMTDRPGTAQKIRLKLGLSSDTTASCTAG